ncbi:MAG TPA: condensation domain-containing protein [Kofleriaceae bacterium]|jgi:non-ribosomal peptide synthetase component F
MADGPLDAALERIVAAAWHAALGVPPAGADEDFFAAGGHSLVATEVGVRLSQVLGIEVPLAMVFDFPTVRGQTAWLGANVHATATACEYWRPGVAARSLAVIGATDARSILQAIAAVGEARGAVEVGATVDLSNLRGRARGDAWRSVARRSPVHAAWCASIARLAPGRHLVALAFDGDRIDATSADAIVADVIAAHARRAAPARELPAIELRARSDERGTWQTRVIPAAIARVLASIAHQQATAPEAAVAALVAAAIARGADRVVIGVPASRGGFGATTTLAPLALDTSGDPSFVTLVDHGRDALIEGWAASAGVAAPAADDVAAIVELIRPAARVVAGGVAWRAIDRPVPYPGRVHVVATFARSGALVLRVAAPADAGALADRLAELLAKIAAKPTSALSRHLPDGARARGAEIVPAARAIYPLTHAQERLWFVEALAPNTSANHIQRVYRVEGLLELPLLERALHELATRHESLRTVFEASGGTVQQVVIGEMPLEHVVHPIASDAEITAIAHAEHVRPFDLSAGPLWRTRICQRHGRHAFLILTIHHLIVDALSVITWLRELAEHYHALATQSVPRLPRLSASIPEIAEWERSPEGRARGEADLAFWLGELGGARPLELPIDFRRPRGHAVGRHEVHEIWSPERAVALRALGRRRGATLNVTLFAAAAAFLARLTGQQDLVCVLPAARRDDPGREAVIGLLLNLLPVRVRLDGDPSFNEIISRSSRAVREAMAHAESPYERIVAALGLPREPGRQPLLDVIVNMVPGTETTRRADLQFTIESSWNSAQPCDMVIGALTRPGGFLDLLIRGRDDLFAAITIERMMKRFATMLAAAVRAPSLPLSELPIVPETERELATVRWNATELALPHATVHDLVTEQLARAPDAIAVVQQARTLTAGELDARSRRVAGFLATKRGARIGVAVPPSPELAIAALGVLRAGAVYVPIAPLAQVGEVDHVMDLGELARAERAEPLRDRVACTPDDPAYVVFTSGSTGRPKSVTTSHRALVNQIAWFKSALPWRTGEVSCLRSSPAFVDAMWELFGPLADGVPLAIATDDEMLDARLLAQLIARHRVTRMVVVPSLLRTLLALDVAPSLDLWLATSEELKPSLVRTFRAARPNDRLVNLYGASETADQVAAYEVAAPDPLRTPIGKPIANSRVYVVDELGLPVPIGVTGELCIAGVGVAGSDIAGGAPTAFVAGERAYRSGDRGRWRYDGELEYLGRVDHLLKIRGVRVDPGEVEAALLERPELTAAVVTAQLGATGDARLVAHVVVAPGARIDAHELRRRLRARLPEPLIPTSFVEMAALPLGPTGKIDRAALPPSPPPAPISSRAPSGATEHAVALAWEHVLGRPVGAEDDFFAAGGESLLAALLGARLAERFGVEPPLSVLFERPTVAAQAAWIDEALHAASATAIPRTPPGEAMPLSFAQERLWFAMQLAPSAPAPKLRSALRIEGPLDRDRLEAALRSVAERQSALRTVFEDARGEVRQRVLADVPRDHVELDFSAEERSRLDELVYAQLGIERDRPFDLANGPPWRTRLLRFGPELHVLAITMHHLVTDGISLGVWRDELHEHYAAGGRAGELTPLVASTIDVAAWQRRAAESATWPVSRRFWKDGLAGARAIELPLAHPRVAWSAGASGRVRAELDEPTAEALATLARAEGTTVFGALLAATAALLRELTGEDDLVVGTIAGGRDRPEVRPLVGLFLNPLPLRVDASGDPSLRELVRRAGAVTRAALAHGEVPFERIVADVNPSRRAFRQPLFDVVLNHHPIADPPRLGDLTVRHVRGVTAPVAPYELMIRTIARRGITVQLDFQRERFDEPSVAQWLARYLELLRAMAGDASRTLSSL